MSEPADRGAPAGRRSTRRGGPRKGGSPRSRGRIDTPRRVAYQTLRQVTGDDAYANLVLPGNLAEAGLSGRDAAFVTELVNGTARHLGTYDAIIAEASGRPIDGLDPELLDVLRLATHQGLAMRVPDHATVAASVELARSMIGEKVTGLTNAVTRKLTRRSEQEWLDRLCAGLDELDTLALRTAHPRWIVDAYAELLPADELPAALAANNLPPRTWLAVRPGLAEVAELIEAGGEPSGISEYAVAWPGDPAEAPGLRQGLVGVQDPGSQLVAATLAAAPAPAGRWLDLCAGPGGKTALLTGLAREHGDDLVAAEVAPHRAELVRQAVRAYQPPPEVVVADGTQPPWSAGSFARVLADVPCTGLGALRRRPEARWRRIPQDLAALVPLQTALLNSALDLVEPGGLVGYVTCSPHRAETAGVVDAVLATRGDVESVPAVVRSAPDAVDEHGRVQLWPHRHGTDAMFLALLRRTR
ncbi:RsmB/NOP family class I SAM-dependent RNA methyltransferase [Naumannella halotolerans]|uniref:16S rRNA (Cytosine967-C5)-methyltransferase n=1 Tax=Naumannella halotolerans TaxID=993414 RepID=A0A4R7JA85_9ACTN|nr:transcription antitermination factor NusB [Naumannella halotolerans]TDT33453.1 16S rRNA (cytosine967-C5)-methyltransferase [Naumannella halotolerans]